ncbi:MAG TPA: tetratricopeptide repeat protein [Vicinamibacteria bacterium]|nr:tetratricopeptide repeat protein [Vicinamibacteria bacterium]
MPFAWVVAGLLLAPHAVTQTAELSLSWERYIVLVRQYQQGAIDWNEALALLEHRGRLESAVGNLSSFPLTTRVLKAAVLMHTEAAAKLSAPGAERVRDLQMEVARNILRLVNEQDFSSKWHLAAGYFYQSMLSPGQALHYFDRLREMAHDDVEVLVATGTVHETYGAFELSKIPRWTRPNPVFVQNRAEQRLVAETRRQAHHSLHRATEWYSKAIDRVPGDAVAYLRRGHCYSLLGQLEQAIADLTRASQLAEQPYERGLAELFLGRLYRESENLAASVSHYRNAVRDLSEWQVGYLALSEVLEASGQRAESREALQLGLSVKIRPNDPSGGLWQYFLRMDAFSDIVVGLREEALP